MKSIDAYHFLLSVLFRTKRGFTLSENTSSQLHRQVSEITIIKVLSFASYISSHHL
jgi:hypothetical protein